MDPLKAQKALSHILVLLLLFMNTFVAYNFAYNQ